MSGVTRVLLCRGSPHLAQSGGVRVDTRIGVGNIRKLRRSFAGRRRPKLCGFQVSRLDWPQGWAHRKPPWDPDKFDLNALSLKQGNCTKID